jgi:signal transduction histidine kinase
MVGGLATLGLLPLRPRHRVDVYSVVIWFGLYKAGIFALVTVSPRATRRIFIAALCIDLLLVFLLLFLTGGGDSPFVNLFYPLVAVNAYYFGRWVGLFLALVAGLLYWAAASLAPPAAAWTAVVNLMTFVGLPAFAVGHVADRERRARSEVELLNAELTGTLTRLRAAQENLVEAERMATVGKLSLKVAHEVRNPIAAIGLNAELLGDMVQGRVSEDGTEATALVTAIRDQVGALDAHRGVPRFRTLPAPAVRGGLRQRHGQRGRGVRPPARRAPGHRGQGGDRSHRAADGDRPHPAPPGGAEPGEERDGGGLPGRQPDAHHRLHG